MEDIAAQEEKEEHQNQLKSKKRRNKYLGGGYDKIADQLLFENNKKHSPILRNGCSTNLGFTIIDTKKYSFSDTCAFDSLFTIVLSATLDSTF